MKPHYRLAQTEDANELKRLNDAFNGKDTNSLESIERGLSSASTETVFVAEQNNQLIGFACGERIVSICYAVPYVVITELYVDQDMRNQGVGQGLMNFLETWYRSQGVENFQLFTGLDNQSAQAFYERIGYRKQDDVLYRKRDAWMK